MPFRINSVGNGLCAVPRLRTKAERQGRRSLQFSNRDSPKVCSLYNGRVLQLRERGLVHTVFLVQNGNCQRINNVCTQKKFAVKEFSLPCTGHTVAALIAEPAHGRLHVSRGNPCENPFVEYALDTE